MCCVLLIVCLALRLCCSSVVWTNNLCKRQEAYTQSWAAWSPFRRGRSRCRQAVSSWSERWKRGDVSGRHTPRSNRAVSGRPTCPRLTRTQYLASAVLGEHLARCIGALSSRAVTYTARDPPAEFSGLYSMAVQHLQIGPGFFFTGDTLNLSFYYNLALFHHYLFLYFMSACPLTSTIELLFASNPDWAIV